MSYNRCRYFFLQEGGLNTLFQVLAEIQMIDYGKEKNNNFTLKKLNRIHHIDIIYPQIKCDEKDTLPLWCSYPKPRTSLIMRKSK